MKEEKYGWSTSVNYVTSVTKRTHANMVETDNDWILSFMLLIV